MDILALLRGSPGAQAWMAQQGPALGALGISPREQLDREMSYDGSHPRQQEQEAINAFRGYGPQMLADAFIPGYGAGGDAKAASEAYGEGRYGAAALNAGMAALDFVPVLGALPAAAKGIRAYHGTKADFDAFDIDETPNGYLWFSSDKAYAEPMAGRTNLSRQNSGTVFETSLSPKKPLEIDVEAEGRRVYEEHIGDVEGVDAAEIEEAYRGGRNFEAIVSDLLPEVEAGGHDMLVFRNTLDGFGKPTDQYVVFDPEIITILRKYGIGGLIAGGGAYALTDAEYAQAAELLAQDGMNTGAQ